jgi:hypothetical protein
MLSGPAIYVLGTLHVTIEAIRFVDRDLCKARASGRPNNRWPSLARCSPAAYSTMAQRAELVALTVDRCQLDEDADFI